MGNEVPNTEASVHYRAGVLIEVKFHHHHGIKNIDSDSPTVDGADYLDCYDAGKSPPAGSTPGEAFIDHAATLGTGAGSFHEWLTDADRGEGWVTDELMCLPRFEV